MTWPTATLDELCEINVGRTPARANPEYWGDGSPRLSIADMNQGREITRTKEQITALGAAGGREVAPGTVLLSFKLSIGKVARSAMPLYTNEAIAALPIKHANLITEKFLMRALERADLSGGSNRAAMGATLNKATLREVAIPLPPLPEQRRIAAILDHADALRAKRRQVLAHFDGLTQSIFHDMFSADRYPSRPLEQVADPDDRINYGVVQPGDETPDGVPLIRVSDMVRGRIDRTNLKRISPTIEASYQRSRIRGNEILVSSVGSIGAVSVVGPADVGSNIARAITRVPVSDEVLRTYVAAYLRTPTPQHYFIAELRTVAQPTLNVGQLAATLIPLPPVTLQAEFRRRLQRVEELIHTVRTYILADDELFASLQSRAFDGRL